MYVETLKAPLPLGSYVTSLGNDGVVSHAPKRRCAHARLRCGCLSYVKYVDRYLLGKCYLFERSAGSEESYMTGLFEASKSTKRTIISDSKGSNGSFFSSQMCLEVIIPLLQDAGLSKSAAAVGVFRAKQRHLLVETGYFIESNL